MLLLQDESSSALPMRLTLDYGTEGLEIELPDERVTVIEPTFRAGIADPGAALSSALRNPLGCQPLRDVITPDRKVAISVCDSTRAQPRQEMLQAVFRELAGVGADDITILIATGTHRANTRGELEQMLGAEIVEQYRVKPGECRTVQSRAEPLIG